MKRVFKKFFNLLGYNISKIRKETKGISQQLMLDISEEVKNIYRECLPYTLISLERIEAIVNAIDYICKYNIPGDIIECGVWRGGAMYAAAKALSLRKCYDRKIFLFDTFEVDAMFATPNETPHDMSYAGKTVNELMSTGEYKKEDYSYRIEDVKALLLSTGYPEKNLILKVGRIEKTLPADDVGQIALLRLDTDWYESTKHELIHLFPKLVKGGVLLIDDYGHWQGCRKAVDEYISENSLQILLHRTDYTGRSAVKL